MKDYKNLKAVEDSPSIFKQILWGIFILTGVFWQGILLSMIGGGI
jgi:hypothetical protein